MILLKCLAIFTLYLLPVILPVLAIALHLEHLAWKRRVIRARAAFACAYNAAKRSQYDPYPTNYPLLSEYAHQAGWNLDYQKSRRGIW